MPLCSALVLVDFGCELQVVPRASSTLESGSRQCLGQILLRDRHSYALSPLRAKAPDALMATL
jgi:hypothetical protein